MKLISFFLITALAALTSGGFILAAPLQSTSPVQPKESKLAPDTSYGDAEFFNDDEDLYEDPAEKQKRYEDSYKRARMAFLFGKYQYAHDLWRPLAVEGYAKAQATLGWMYHTGKGIKKNPKAALAWFQKAAAQSHVIAQNNLGVFYEQGLGVKKSLSKAAYWYKESAELGYSYAQYNLGILYLKGKGIKKSRDDAMYWLQIASLQGVKQAQMQLDYLSGASKHKNAKSKSNKPTKPNWTRRYAEDPNITTKNLKPKMTQESASLKDDTTQTKPKHVKSKKVKRHFEHVKQGGSGATSEKNKSSKSKSYANRFHTKRVAKNTTDTSTKSPQIVTNEVLSNNWIEQQTPSDYTLQLTSGSNLEQLIALAKSYQLVRQFAYYKTASRKGNSYSLIYGNFATKKSAEKTMSRLPGKIRKLSPSVKQISDIQKNMR